MHHVHPASFRARALPPLALLLLLAVACEGSAGDAPATPDAAIADGAGGSDVASDAALADGAGGSDAALADGVGGSDVAPDTRSGDGDVIGDGGGDAGALPDPAFVFAVRERPSCVSDTPYLRHVVTFDRDATALPAGLVAAPPDGWALDAAGLRRDGALVWSAPEGEAPVAFAVAGERALVATPRRAVLLSVDGATVEELEGWEAAPAQLPAADVTAVALAPDGAWAVGHAVGLSVRTPEGPTPFAHRASRRWLPADEVTALAWDDDGSLWAATPGGVARLALAETTLAEKAEAMLAAMERHWRLGFVSPNARFADPDDLTDPHLTDDDNDGQWSEEALAALCYAYATTGEERYRTRARRILEAMFRLFDIPAVSFAEVGRGRGFVARSVVRDDEGAVFESKATQSNWHPVTWEGRDWYWKDDTSSDEMIGHFFGLPLYHDLCAEDAAERAEVAAYVADFAGAIVADGFRLIDLDGERTTHGHWDPDTLAIAVDGMQACMQHHPIDACADAWGGGAFLNSIQILGALLASWHVTGEARFLEAYELLVTEHRYDELATFSDHVLTWTSRPIANYVDHELAAIAFPTLIRYEPNEERRARWIASQFAAWEYEVGERSPVKAAAMAAVSAEDGPWVAAGVRTLREYPEDLRHWAVDNGHRSDLERDVADRFGSPQFTTVPPYDEVHVMRWDRNPYAVARDGDGRSTEAPTWWLLPYWSLRYHGAICP